MREDNPRHPHKLVISRVKLDDQGEIVYDEDANEVYEVVFESECGYRAITRGIDLNVDEVNADYKLSLPFHRFIIRKGDRIVVYNSINNEVKEGVVEDAKPNNLGCKIWFNQKGNARHRETD